MDIDSPMEIENGIFIYPEDDVIQLSLEGQCRSVKLEPRVMKVLLLLVANQGSVVTREEFLNDIWDHYQGSDEALTQAVSLLRKSIRDTKKADRLIETIPKKGYRLNARVIQKRASVKASRKDARGSAYSASYERWLMAALLILALVLAGLLMFIPRDGGEARAPEAPRSERAP